jgi:hypothetical protein
MASTKPASSDFGAAMSGLVLGGSVLFLLMLAIVWLTNRKFEGHAPAGAPPAATAPAAPTAH